MMNDPKEQFIGPDHFGNSIQFAGAQKLIVAEGKGKGTSIIRVRNGKGLDFCILPDKGMDVFDVYFDGVQLAWISRNGLVANSFYDDKGMGWLRSFGGGMLTTCGLRNVGPPEEDGGEHFGLHGRICGIPAVNVNVSEYWQGDVFNIEISGEMYETNVFGEDLVLKRTYRLRSDSNTIDLHDQIINRGNKAQQIMLLYHLNWGFPLLSTATNLKLNAKNVVVRGDDQSEVDQWGNFLAPQDDYTERVYFFDLIADERNQVHCLLSNSALKKSVKISWDKKQLPIFTEWKMMGKGDYVLGLVPGNSLPVGRKGAREDGSAEFLEGHEVKDVKIKIQFFNI